MKDDSAKLSYELPLHFNDYTGSFHIRINVNSTGMPYFGKKGLLHDQVFDRGQQNASFEWETRQIQLNKPVYFSIPLTDNKPQICISKENGYTNFVLRLFPGLPRYYPVNPKDITVFWDASKSSVSRNLEKEIDFLERYIAVNDIKKTSIILFNQEIIMKVIYQSGKDRFSVFRNYLLNHEYRGATVFGNLDFSSPQSDAILLFSDGINSFGKSLPVPGTVPKNGRWSAETSIGPPHARSTRA